MTVKDLGDTVVYQLAYCEHPLVVGEDDDRTDEELVEAVEKRTTVDDDMEFPGWKVFVSDPPDAETLRYVNTKTRVNIKGIFEEIPVGHKTERDIVDVFTDHVKIDDFDGPSFGVAGPNIDVWTRHIDDFDGDIHLDITDQ